MRNAYRTAGLTLVAALALPLAGCGGSDKAGTTGPSSATPSSTPSSASASPSASPSPTESAPALSRFEDEPAVKAARAWNAAYGRDINHLDAKFTRTAKLSTANAQLSFYGATDLQTKGVYPGPPPFTPVRVVRAGSVTHVISCAEVDGWVVNRKTRAPTAARKVIPVSFDMKKDAGVWKLDGLTTAQVSCDNVVVKAIPWADAGA